MDKLLINVYFGQCLSDPVKLQEYVWFSLCLQFGRRGHEGWRAMQKDYFVADTDSDGKRFIGTLSTESTKNIPGGNKQSDQDYSDTRMYEVSGSRLCPVQAYEVYRSKLHPDNPCLFAKAKKNFTLDSSIWYTKEVLWKNTIGDIIKGISKNIHKPLRSSHYRHKLISSWRGHANDLFDYEAQKRKYTQTLYRFPNLSLIHI